MSPETPEKRKLPSKPWMRLAGAGMELAATVILLSAVGYLLDRWFGVEDRLNTFFFAVGAFGLAMYRFIRLSLRVSEEQRELERQRQDDAG
ncbi:MAG: AtpZ/AtpI family protein [Planctomycetota bacterium]